EVPPRNPPLSLERRGQRLGPRADGHVLSEDAELDRAILLFDRRGAAAPILDAEMRARMLVHLQGWLGVWPQRGAHYRARHLDSEAMSLANLVTLLRDIAMRTA